MSRNAGTQLRALAQPSSSPAVVVCPLRRCRAVLEIDVDRVGRIVTRCPGCERRRAGVCRDCPVRVYGTPGKALRCARCAKRARRRSDKQQRLRPEVRRRANARARQRRRTDPLYAERRRALSRRWSQRNPERRRAAARRLLLSEGPTRQKYLETQRRHNADPIRQKKKRAWALARYYERHPVRPDPHCRGCDRRLEYSPLGKKGAIGAPPRWCDECCPPAELRRRRKLGRSIRVALERAS